MSASPKNALDQLRVETPVMAITSLVDFMFPAKACDTFTNTMTSGYQTLIAILSEASIVGYGDRLDSTIGSMRAARLAGRGLRITNPSGWVTLLPSLTSLDQVIKTHMAVAEAIDDVS